MAILGCFIRREITAYGSSKQVSRQLNRLFNGSLPYSAALPHSACLAQGWVYGFMWGWMLQVWRSRKSSWGPCWPQCKVPWALCPVSPGLSPGSCSAEQAALPPPACPRLGLEFLVTRGGEVGCLGGSWQNKRTESQAVPREIQAGY